MTLTIGWLYPELMSTYGDRGNIFVLAKRCEWRKIQVSVRPIDFKTSIYDLSSYDLIFGGGAQDRQQGLVIDDLLKKGPWSARIIRVWRAAASGPFLHDRRREKAHRSGDF